MVMENAINPSGERSKVCLCAANTPNPSPQSEPLTASLEREADHLGGVREGELPPLRPFNMQLIQGKVTFSFQLQDTPAVAPAVAFLSCFYLFPQGTRCVCGAGTELRLRAEGV